MIVSTKEKLTIEQIAVLKPEQLVEMLDNLSNKELMTVANLLKEKHGLDEMTFSAGASNADAGAAKNEVVEYDIQIKTIGSKLKAIVCLKDKDWSKSDMPTAKAYLENDSRPNLSEFIPGRKGKKFSEADAKAILADLTAAEVVAEMIAVK